jgi:hypothetical protein
MTTRYFAVYDPTGEIVSTGSYDDDEAVDLSHLAPRCLESADPVDPALHYVAAGEIASCPPRPAHSRWDWQQLAWVEDIEGARAAKAAEIEAACQAQILAGFDSSALGEPHHYPAKLTDQQNLSASVLASLLPGLPADWTTPFWCAGEAGAWAYLPHTAAQIQHAGAGAKAAILDAMLHNEQLQAAIAAAGTIDELGEIAW